MLAAGAIESDEQRAITLPASLSCAGIIRAQWKGAETLSLMARFAPFAFNVSQARSIASALPAITICEGELMFAFFDK